MIHLRALTPSAQKANSRFVRRLYFRTKRECVTADGSFCSWTGSMDARIEPMGAEFVRKDGLIGGNSEVDRINVAASCSLARERFQAGSLELRLMKGRRL